MNNPFGNGRSKRSIHVPGYDGPDRREEARRGSDILTQNFKLFAAAVGLGMTILSGGVAWGVVKTKLDGMVTMTQFVQKNAQQDTERQNLQAQVNALQNAYMNEVVPELRVIKLRLRDIYCDGKPPGCQ